MVTTKRLNAGRRLHHLATQLHDGLLRPGRPRSRTRPAARAPSSPTPSTTRPGASFKTHDAVRGATVAAVRARTCSCRQTATSRRQTVTVYDGAGREIAAIYQVDGRRPARATEKWRTTTGYGGDRTDVTPPAGRHRHLDRDRRRRPHGRAAAVPRRRRGRQRASRYDATSYDYNRKGQLTGSPTRPATAGRYGYDLRGRQITRSTDPDKGTTTTDLQRRRRHRDRPRTRRGAMHRVHLRRASAARPALRDGRRTGAKRAEWVYDTLANGTAVKGQLVKTIRYERHRRVRHRDTRLHDDYKPTSVKYTIPRQRDRASPARYTYVYTYNAGRLAGHDHGCRPSATWRRRPCTYGYNALGQADHAGHRPRRHGRRAYVHAGTEYTSFGELGAIHLRNNAGTPGRHRAHLRGGHPPARPQIWTTQADRRRPIVADVRYSYDPAGNVTRSPTSTAGDTQCFPTTTCAGSPRRGHRPTATAPPPPRGRARRPGAVLAHRTATTPPATGPSWSSTTRGRRHAPPTTRTRPARTGSTGHRRHRQRRHQHRDLHLRPRRQHHDPARRRRGTQTLPGTPRATWPPVTDTTGTTSLRVRRRRQPADPRATRPAAPCTCPARSCATPTPAVPRRAPATTATPARLIAHAHRRRALTWLAGDHQGTAQIAINAVGQAVGDPPARRRSAHPRHGTGTWPPRWTRASSAAPTTPPA